MTTSTLRNDYTNSSCIKQWSHQLFLVCVARQGFPLENAQKLHSTQLDLCYYILNKWKTFFWHHLRVWPSYSCMQHNHHLRSLVDSKKHLLKFCNLRLASKIAFLKAANNMSSVIRMTFGSVRHSNTIPLSVGIMSSL